MKINKEIVLNYLSVKPEIEERVVAIAKLIDKDFSESDDKDYNVWFDADRAYVDYWLYNKFDNDHYPMQVSFGLDYFDLSDEELSKIDKWNR